MNINLTSKDVLAIECALSVLPEYDVFNETVESDKVVEIATGAFSNLSAHRPLTNQQTYLVSLAIDYAVQALNGELSISPDGLADLRPHSSTLVKLHPAFLPFLDMI